MNKSKEAKNNLTPQTEEQRLAVRIIKDLKRWANWSPDLTTSSKRLLYRLSINNKLQIDPIIQKLELEGKDGAAKRFEQLRDTVIEGVKAYLENDKYIDAERTSCKPIPTVKEKLKGKFVNLTVLPSDELKRDALRLVEVLERAMPYLGSQPAKDSVADLAKGQWYKRIISWIFAKTSHFIWAIIIATVGSFIATILIRYFW